MMHACMAEAVRPWLAVGCRRRPQLQWMWVLKMTLVQTCWALPVRPWLAVGPHGPFVIRTPPERFKFGTRARLSQTSSGSNLNVLRLVPWYPEILMTFFCSLGRSTTLERFQTSFLRTSVNRNAFSTLRFRFVLFHTIFLRKTVKQTDSLV